MRVQDAVCYEAVDCRGVYRLELECRGVYRMMCAAKLWSSEASAGWSLSEEACTG